MAGLPPGSKAMIVWAWAVSRANILVKALTKLTSTCENIMVVLRTPSVVMPWLVICMGGLSFSERKGGGSLRGGTGRRGGKKRKMWSSWENIIVIKEKEPLGQPGEII